MGLTSGVIDDFIITGYAVVDLGLGERSALENVLARSTAFFGRPEEEKLRHSGEAYNFGYRPMGIEYSVTPDRPDCDECFTLWSDRLDLIPGAGGLQDLTAALLRWRSLCAELADEVLRGCAGKFGGSAPPFAAASHLQVNNYPPAPAGRDLLQDRHEDGHLVTILHATGPGLEIVVNGTAQPFTTAVDEVLVMAGSILTTLSGNTVPPLFHQVRNLQLNSRQSVMYFVNPELSEPIYSWTSPEDQRDLRDAVRSNPLMFGLPAVQEL
ncbi:MAG: 2OG-Fe(II) oxygenase family protein [Steroidobacteraceae bacterium]